MFPYKTNFSKDIKGMRKGVGLLQKTFLASSLYTKGVISILESSKGVFGILASSKGVNHKVLYPKGVNHKVVEAKRRKWHLAPSRGVKHFMPSSKRRKWIFMGIGRCLRA